MMSWNPQWLLFAAPFLILAICTNKNYTAFIYLDFIFIYAFYAYVTKIFVNNVDQALLQHGVLMNLLRYRIPLEPDNAMQKFYIFDTTTLLTIIVCVLVFYFIASFTKFSMKNFSSELVNIKALCYIKYFYCVFLFVIPSVLCGIQLYNQPEKLWDSYVTQEKNYIKEMDIKNSYIMQEVRIPRGQINSIYLQTKCPKGKNKSMYMQAEILDSNKRKIAICRVSSNDINEDGHTVFDFGITKIKKANHIISKYHQVQQKAF